MEHLVGVTLALLVCGAASLLGMDRDRAFYPAMLMAVASYYVAFAVNDGSAQVLLAEASIGAAYVAAALFGYRRSAWLVAGALAGHGVMDLFHHLLVDNTGVPAAWPGFCMAFDLAAAVCVAAVLTLRSPKVAGSREGRSRRQLPTSVQRAGVADGTPVGAGTSFGGQERPLAGG